MALLDQNQRPISAGNGAQSRDKVDVRVLPSGTLFFNLIRYAGEEIGIDNMIKQLEEIKVQQKMVADPPQLEALHKHLGMLQASRYVIANELNERFADIDKARLDKLGITIEEPAQEG